MTNEAEPHYVYRLFTATGELLYVGSSGKLRNRLAAHARVQTWWHEVADVRVERFPDKASARAEEQAVIDAESPRCNESRVIGKTPIRGVRIPDDLYFAAQSVAEIEGDQLSSVIRDALREYVKAFDAKRQQAAERTVA